MKTGEAIHSRRSLKHFDANHSMTTEEANEILSLAILSPTAFNIQNWRFVVVDDADLRKKNQNGIKSDIYSRNLSLHK